MGSRTRDKLIEVAKSLFVHQGVEKTTIGDIATASEKGRRTIYTYFKSKIEIYDAVIERESDNMVKALRDIAESPDTASRRLRKFFELLFTENQATDTPRVVLKSLLKFDFIRNERIRKKAYAKEEEILISILDDGIRTGEFDRSRCGLMRDFLFRLLHAIDAISLQDESTPMEPWHTDAFISFLVKGVQR